METYVQSVRESFMSLFKLIDPNQKYLPAKIATFYYVVGGFLLESPIENATTSIDMRFSFGLCISSGLGKEAIKNVVMESANNTEKEWETFTSLHEEQLIGKRWMPGKTAMTVLGYCHDDFLIKDDSLSFLNEDKFAIARNYMLTALDVYRKNLISKRLTEQSLPLQYFGRCSFLYFLQPSEKIILKNLSGGLFRRAPILRIDLTREEIDEIIDKRLVEEHKPSPDAWYDFLRNLRNIRIKVYRQIDKGLLKKINEVVKRHYSQNILLDSLKITNQNNLLKFSYINSLLRNYNPLKPYNPETGLELEIAAQDVENAINDFEIIYGAIANFAEKNMSGAMHPIQKAIINMLERKQCYSLETSTISSSEIIARVASALNEKEDTVKYHFYNVLKAVGIIETKQVGQNDSRVWLK